MRDAFVISTVIGLMVTVMGSMMAFFATGMDEDGIISSLRTGFVLGLGVGTVVLMFALARVRNHAEKGQAREESRAAEVAVLREEMSHLSDETDGAWDVGERIRRERGVLTFDKRLRIGAEAVDWQVLEKAGSITLRPMGIAPTNAQRVRRFAIFVVPMCTVMGFTFRDLAGSTLEEQGLAFGIVAGVLLTALLSSYRDRSG